MISISNNSMKQTLHQYLLQYRSIFKKRSYLLFTWLISAIICVEETRSVKFLYDNFIKKYCQKALTSFYYFLSYSKFSCNALQIVTVKIALSLIPSEMKQYTTIFLTVDDTLQAKFGKKFACYFKLFDHTSKNGTPYLNGHCFVSLVINIPVFIGKTARYLTIPVGYRLYDKQQSKLKIAASMIHTVMPLMEGYQVVLLCDSWYPKGEVIDAVKAYDNLDIICAVRSDTVLYDLPPARTGKRGRPRKYGDKLYIKNFDYEKVGDYYMASQQVLTNLFGTIPVTVTVTVRNIETFESIRVYISTVEAQDLYVFKEHKMEKIPTEPKKQKYLLYFVYGLRWNIEVLFYEHKFFWSFGNYMVRNKAAIERYVNLISLTFAFMQILPFICKQFEAYKFKSPQVIKHAVADWLLQELIFETFVQSLQNNKIYATVATAVRGFLGVGEAA